MCRPQRQPSDLGCGLQIPHPPNGGFPGVCFARLPLVVAEPAKFVFAALGNGVAISRLLPPSRVMLTPIGRADRWTTTHPGMLTRKGLSMAPRIVPLITT